MDNLREVKITK